MLKQMATRIREQPTIPASPDDPQVPWKEALNANMAVELPEVHCCVQGCSWIGARDNARDAHILSDHKQELLCIADTLPFCFSEESRTLSAYNEVIATKVRQGAPVASYALQRKAVQSYMAFVQGNAIQSPMCFICACKFPYVASREENDISWVKPCTLVSEEDQRVKIFFDKEYIDVINMFGLTTYLENYVRKEK